jgi:polar amino acid transport system permease protein
MDQVAFIIQVLLPALADGLVLTLALIAVSAPFGFLLGAGLAVGRTYGSRPLSFTARAFVAFVKGCPLLLLLFILYFGLPAVGVRFSPFEAAAIGFIFCNGAYNSEYIRGALLSIKEGQMTAAFALGMTRNQGIRYILLPQALRRAIPGMTNEFIYLIKYSSLAYMITVIEITGAGKLVAAKYFAFFETFTVIGLFYLGLVSIATIALGFLERKLAIPGLVSK